MTRLYYDCPIEAAHMAKRFGMRFVSWHSSKEYEPCVILANAGSPIKSVRDGQRYVVHAESLHLLEPRVGDLEKRYSDPNALRIYNVVKGDSERKIVWRDGSYNWPNEIEAIIQRDRRPFFWPKREAA